MGHITDIIKGHVNEAFDSHADLSEERLNICKTCPLYKDTIVGPICNPSLYMNELGELSDSAKYGYKKGCGCRLMAKTRLLHATCTHGRW